MVVLKKRSHTGRCSGINEVAGLEREKSGSIFNDGVHGENHVGRTTVLNGFPVDVEFDVDILNVAQVFDIDEIANLSRRVEALADFPRLAFLAQLLLDVAGGQIETDGDFFVIPMREFGGDVLAQFSNFDDQFRLIMDFV